MTRFARLIAASALSLVALLSTAAPAAAQSAPEPVQQGYRADQAAIELDQQLREAFGANYRERFQALRAAQGEQAGVEGRLQQGWFDWIELMLKYAAVLLPSQRLDYASFTHDASGGHEGQSVQLSGRIYFPLAERKGEREAVPLIVYCHGTELRRRAVPSNLVGMETSLMALLATVSRSAVALPDYIGMGWDDRHFHPYCQLESSAYAVLDCIPGAIAQLEARKDARWNGEVYIVGYSEGGYAALAAVKELHTNPRYASLRACVKGAAPMAGPFDLSGTMRDVMVGEAKHPNPFFLSYVIYGYAPVYGLPIVPVEAMNPELLLKSDGRNMDNYMNGGWSGSEVNDFIRRRLGVGKGEPVLPLATLNASWSKAQLTSQDYPATAVGGILVKNDLVGNRFHRASWNPAEDFRTFLFHSRHDDNVPVGNTVQAVASWPTAKTFVSMPDDWFGQKLDHVQGAMVGIPMAFLWIKAGMPVR